MPLRPLGLSDILSGAFTLIRHNPKATLGLTAIIQTIAAVFTTFLTWSEQRLAYRLRNGIGPQSTSVQAGHAVLSFFASFVPILLAAIVVTFVIQSILTGMLTGVLGEGLLGSKISMGQAWRMARVLSVIGMSLLLGLILAVIWIPPAAITVVLVAVLAKPAAALAVLIGVLGGLGTLCLEAWVAIRLSLGVPAVVLEAAGPWTALKRSWQLVRKSWWRVFGITLLTWLILTIVAFVFDFLFGIVAGIAGGGGSGPFGFGAAVNPTPPSLIALLIGAVGGIIATTCTRPVSAGVTVLLYTDMRMRKEGLDLALQQAAPTPTGQDFMHVWLPGSGQQGTGSVPGPPYGVPASPGYGPPPGGGYGPPPGGGYGPPPGGGYGPPPASGPAPGSGVPPPE